MFRDPNQGRQLMRERVQHIIQADDPGQTSPGIRDRQPPDATTAHPVYGIQQTVLLIDQDNRPPDQVCGGEGFYVQTGCHDLNNEVAIGHDSDRATIHPAGRAVALALPGHDNRANVVSAHQFRKTTQ